ncbi:MAG: cyclase family protein [Kiloniellales bacterium]|nr:cyclase family protein [Kiloniellales bacterium]
MPSDEKRRWTRRPPGSNWGDFGPDDRLGTLNHLTPNALLQARQEIQTGQVFCLSLPLDRPGGSVLNPRRKPPVLRPTMRGTKPNYNYALGSEQAGATDVISDDWVALHSQYSTQWDSLAHGGALFDADGDGTAELVYYNGFRAGSHVRVEPDGEGGFISSAGPLGVDAMAAKGVAGRGILIDLQAQFGSERRCVSFADIQSVISKDQITVRPGDILCLHTGFADHLLAMEGEPDLDDLAAHALELDGRDEALLDWLTRSRVAALAADNYAVEALPAKPAATPVAAAPLHEHCLFKIGMPLGELWHLGQLARWLRANARHAFFLTAPPLRLPGASGSPLTPLAIV